VQLMWVDPCRTISLLIGLAQDVFPFPHRIER
jgi:hypothetical protein